MLAEFGVDLVELGHSERRAAFGETDAAVNAKVKTALRHGLRPLVCVGDTAPERDAGASVEAIVRQVKLAFAGLDAGALGRCLVAYEPVWAIGERGAPAQPGHVRLAHAAIRRALQERTRIRCRFRTAAASTRTTRRDSRRNQKWTGCSSAAQRGRRAGWPPSSARPSPPGPPRPPRGHHKSPSRAMRSAKGAGLPRRPHAAPEAEYGTTLCVATHGPNLAAHIYELETIPRQLAECFPIAG